LIRYADLPATLRRLGFDDVSFSFPRREPGSSSLVYDERSELVDLNRDELLEALTAIRELKKQFAVFNPAASLDEVGRFVRSETQTIPCVGGYKYFYLDWNLDVWRCEAWSEPMGSVFDLDHVPDQRDRCNACMIACYRSASTLLHAPIAMSDAAHAFAAGRLGKGMASLFQPGVPQSIGALITHGHRNGRRPKGVAATSGSGLRPR
jgi:hypothetical protein